MYLINIVYSEGLYSGRESVPIVGNDREKVIEDAFAQYVFESAAGLSENTDLNKAEFTKRMMLGFEDKNEFVLIQYPDSHIQFEPFVI